MNAEKLAAIEARAEAATPGPWEHGDRQSIAGVMPEKFGEGKCVACRHGDPSWIGKRDINGKRMLAHVHTRSEPWWNHGIFAYREDGSINVVNDTDVYGYIDQPDAEFIAHARTDVPDLVAEVERLQTILRQISVIVQTVDTETDEALQDALAENVWQEIPQELRASPETALLTAIFGTQALGESATPKSTPTTGSKK